MNLEQEIKERIKVKEAKLQSISEKYEILVAEINELKAYVPALESVQLTEETV